MMPNSSKRYLGRGNRGTESTDETADVYTRYTDQYLAYADGNVLNNLFDFGPRRSFGWVDREVWQELSGQLQQLCAARGGHVKILDVGCGPGTWAARLAQVFGPQVEHLQITGLDIAAGQLRRARELVRRTGVTRTGQVEVRFLRGDVCRGLEYPDGEFDLTLCLNTVLNHLDPEQMQCAVAEMMRVTRGVHVSTIRGKWGMPTAYVGDLDQFQVTQDGDLLRGLDSRGRPFQLPSYLHECHHVQEAFAQVAEVVDCYGLDFLVSKVLSRQASSHHPPRRALFEDGLRQIEDAHRRDPRFLDLANHVVVVACPRQNGEPS